jgi:hypothetical protein
MSRWRSIKKTIKEITIQFLGLPQDLICLLRNNNDSLELKEPLANSIKTIIK